MAFPRNLFYYYFQKESHADVLQNRCYYKFCNIHKKTYVLESLFNKVAGPTACNFISTSSQETSTQVIPVIISKYLWKVFLWNTCGCFCQLDKVTVHWWAFPDLLFLIKSKIYGMVSTKQVCRSAQKMLFAHY